MSNIYNPDRIQKISEIMPKFMEHVEVGDEIHMGLDGDPRFPVNYRSSRPSGVVSQVKKADGGVDLKVKLSDGRSVKVAANTVDPRYVWEFTDASFDKVLQRATQRRQASFRSTATTAIVPAASNASASVSLQKMQAEIKDMKALLENEISESRAFNNTVIASMNEIAADVCAVNKNAEFCSVLHKEYSRMNSKPALQNNVSKNKVHVFDSDYESSDDDL